MPRFLPEVDEIVILRSILSRIGDRFKCVNRGNLRMSAVPYSLLPAVMTVAVQIRRATANRLCCRTDLRFEPHPFRGSHCWYSLASTPVGTGIPLDRWIEGRRCYCLKLLRAHRPVIRSGPPEEHDRMHTLEESYGGYRPK